ncbi:hypothetical protein F909_01373 [Acinetobacter sp. ANC 3929]|nr:hypothetical protein F909_01373 [Acinetobacter sp. ANC 3929]
MTQAAITTLATQASVSLINNGGDITKTLNELGSNESVRGLATSIVTAGLLSLVGTALNLKPDSTYFPDRLMNNFTSSIGSTLVQTAINGGNLQDNLEKALLAGLAGVLQGELASQIGNNLDKVDPNTFEYVLHKVAHAAAGCAAAAATKASCEAGAIGAGVGEIVAELMIPAGKTALDLTDAERTRIKDTSKIIAGATAAFAGYDVNTAANSANVAVENNALGKVVTTAGKAAYKVARKISDMPAAARANLKPSEIAEMLRKEGVQGVIDIGDNLITLVSPTSTLGDRAFALIDLAIGVDLKAGKNVDVLKVDRKIIEKNVQGVPNLGGAKGLVGVDFELYLKNLYGGKGSFKLGGREFDGALGNRWYEAKSGNYWNDVIGKEDGLVKFRSDMGSRLAIAKANNATYELHSNTPIPQNIKDWLTQKGIKFYEH